MPLSQCLYFIQLIQGWQLNYHQISTAFFDFPRFDKKCVVKVPTYIWFNRKKYSLYYVCDIYLDFLIKKCQLIIESFRSPPLPHYTSIQEQDFFFNKSIKFFGFSASFLVVGQFQSFNAKKKPFNSHKYILSLKHKRNGNLANFIIFDGKIISLVFSIDLFIRLNR